MRLPRQAQSLKQFLEAASKRETGKVVDATVGCTRPGDTLILTKGLGVGIYSAAIKMQALSESGYREMIASTTLLNRIGSELAQDASVHAVTE